jgi:excisionase family DNA binding protein
MAYPTERAMRRMEMLLTIAEASSHLRVSEKTIRRWIQVGYLPAAKLGSQWRIRPQDLEDFTRDRLSR